MLRLKVTLGIGLANANQEDVLDIPQDEYDACETDAARAALFEAYWQDWVSSYLDGGYELMEGETK